MYLYVQEMVNFMKSRLFCTENQNNNIDKTFIPAEKFNHMAENRWRNDNVIHAPKTIMDVLILES